MYETRELTIRIPAVVVPSQFMLIQQRLYRKKSMRDFLIWVKPQERPGTRPRPPGQHVRYSSNDIFIFMEVFFFSWTVESAVKPQSPTEQESGETPSVGIDRLTRTCYVNARFLARNTPLVL